MNALLAMQIEAIMVLSIVVITFLARTALIQLALCLHYKSKYENQLAKAAAFSQPRVAITGIPNSEPTIISAAQPALKLPNYSVV